MRTVKKAPLPVGPAEEAGQPLDLRGVDGQRELLRGRLPLGHALRVLDEALEAAGVHGPAQVLDQGLHAVLEVVHHLLVVNDVLHCKRKRSLKPFQFISVAKTKSNQNKNKQAKIHSS